MGRSPRRARARGWAWARLALSGGPDDAARSPADGDGSAPNRDAPPSGDEPRPAE